MEVSVENSKDDDKDIAYFEFAINRRDLENYLYSKDQHNIWIICKINTRTKEVTHSFGR